MRRALAVLALAAIAAGGCGGSDEAESPPGNDPFYGVVSVAAPNPTDFERMAAGGVGTYRVVLAWSSVETTKGVYDWNQFDATYTELARHGIDPLTTVVGTPAAYAEVLTDPPTKDAETFDAWADFLEEAAERYGPDGVFWQEFERNNPDIEPQPITTWEIWNEPNTALFWTPAPDADAYAALLKRSARILHGADPDARVMVGGMFATPQSEGAIVSYDFIEQLYAKNGVAEAIDDIAIHPYSPDVDGVIDQLDGTREAIDAAGDDAGISITELGWSSDPAGPADQAKTPEQQANLLRKAYSKMYENRDEWGLDTVVWFSWTDSDGPVGECQWCEFAGLVDTDRDTKPSWEAYTELAGGTP
jgi:polysaccharide biosynthesis protein PslG